jgi:hypothetical protein
MSHDGSGEASGAAESPNTPMASRATSVGRIVRESSVGREAGAAAGGSAGGGVGLGVEDVLTETAPVCWTPEEVVDSGDRAGVGSGVAEG